MASVLGSILPEAIGIALSPIPIIGLILMLFSKQARTNGPAFLVGWLLGLLIVGGIVLALVSAGKLALGEGTKSTLSLFIELLLGLGCFFLAFRNWKQRPKPGQEPEMPKWMATIDNIKPGAALGLGALLSGVNPKNLLLNVAAATTIAASGLEQTQQLIVLVIFTLIASVSIIVPVVYYLAAGASAEKALTGLKTWMVANNSAIMAVILLLIGAKLFGQAIGGLL